MPPSDNIGDRFGPVRMQRVAIVAPQRALRDALVRVGDAGLRAARPRDRRVRQW